MTEVTLKAFRVEHTGKCKKVFIPKGYCTIYLEGQKEGNIEIDMVGADVCIQVLDLSYPCLAGAGKKRGKSKRV